MAARKGPTLVGRSVVDSEGVELGYVASEEDRFLVLGEGPTGKLRLGRRFVDRIADRVTLRAPSVEMFTGLNVVDVQGDFVGIVRDTVESEDVLDSFIVEDEQGEMVTVLLEDVRSIDEWLELGVTSEALYEG
jgi:sporulation protein YlmC with PRC-barrel domain